MENTFVVNDEPVTIKITIEVIPPGKKENIKEEPVVKPPIVSAPMPPRGGIGGQQTPKGWDVVELEPVDPVPPVVPEPEKKKRAYTRKAKTTEPPVEEEKKVEPPIEEKPVEEAKPSVVPPVTTANYTSPPIPNKMVARLAQMIRFYCKASGIETSTITIAHLKEKAFDIVENVADDVITEAIKEASKK